MYSPSNIDADGSVRHWHVTSGKSLGSLQDQEQTNHLTYRQDGQYFATVGTDLQVRSYDAHTLKNITTASYGSRDTAAGHSNRIFCCKYNPTNPNILITAGWDEAIQVWDMRTQVSVRSIFGPHICGDSLDFSNDGKNLMSGSYSAKEGVQVFFI